MSIKNYKIGYLTNPLKLNRKIKKVTFVGKSCRIIIPARVNTFLCYHNYFAYPLRSSIYPVGSINFSINKFTQATVTVRDDNKIIINASNKHLAIIEHIVRIMQKTLGIKNGFNINAYNLHKISHGGLGSSSAIMSAVAQAINKLSGTMLSVAEITKLISQNYGEESLKKGFVSSAASIGGSTAVGLSGKSLIIIGGESEIWNSSNLPKKYSAVLLYPKKLKRISTTIDNNLNKKEFSLLQTIDNGFGGFKENLLREKIIPALNKRNYSILFKAINMYTMGAYGNIPEYFNERWAVFGVPFALLIPNIFSKLSTSLKINETCFFVSSNGPLIVIISKCPSKTSSLLKEFNNNFYIEKVQLSRGLDYTLVK